MFDWIGDALSWVGDKFSNVGTAISEAVWDVMLEWLFNTIYGAVAEFFGMMNGMGVDIFSQSWVSAFLQLFDKRSDDKTNANVLILGNSGQGKSYLMKLLLTNLRESGKSVIILDAEQEYADLTNNLGGTYLDFMSGEYMINPLEPKSFGEAEKDDTSPEPFRKVTRLSQHTSYLKDFFRSYKDFSDNEIDTIEIMLMKLYARFDIDDLTDFDKLKPMDYPVMQDLYDLIEKEFMIFDHEKKHLYTEETL